MHKIHILCRTIERSYAIVWKFDWNGRGSKTRNLTLTRNEKKIFRHRESLRSPYIYLSWLLFWTFEIYTKQKLFRNRESCEAYIWVSFRLNACGVSRVLWSSVRAKIGVLHSVFYFWFRSRQMKRRAAHLSTKYLCSRSSFMFSLHQSSFLVSALIAVYGLTYTTLVSLIWNDMQCTSLFSV